MNTASLVVRRARPSRLAALCALGLLGLGACTSDAVSIAAAAPTELPAAAARTGADAYRQLLDYSALGLHRSGTEGGARLVDWLDGRLRGYGLQTAVEPFDFMQFVPRKAALSLADGSDIAVFPYWYSGRTGSEGLRAELVDVGSGTPARFAAGSVAGKLVLADIALLARGNFSNLAEVIQRAHGAGALGVVAAIQGPANLIVAANAESEAGLCGLPVLFVGAEDGRRVRRNIGSSPDRLAQFTLDADYRAGRSANVIATIPGRSAETLIIGTPTNGWFTTATERGAGVGTLLSLAHHYAERYGANGRPDKTLVFVFSGGHEVGFLGLQRYIDAHPALIASTYGYVHLGAAIAGSYYFQQADGSVAQAPIADPARTLFVSENPLLQRLVSARQLSSGLAPIQTMLPSILNPGEQRRMYARGVPMVSISGTTLYFHTEADTPETTSAALLDPAVQFYGAVIDDLLAADPAEIRAANSVAARHAKPLPAPVCAAPGG